MEVTGVTRGGMGTEWRGRRCCAMARSKIFAMARSMYRTMGGRPLVGVGVISGGAGGIGVGVGAV